MTPTATKVDDPASAAAVDGLSFRERDPIKLGVVVSIVVVLGLVLAFNAHAIIRHFGTFELEAVFSEAGGLTAGDEVRVAGRPVGTVSSVTLDGNTVLAKMRVERGTLLRGETRAQVKTATVLGKKYVMLIPEGPGRLHAGARIPLSRTQSAYDLVQTLADLSQAASGIDTKQLAQALNGLSGTFEQTPTQFGRALTGIRGLSASLATRDEQLRQVFRRSAALSAILAQRRGQVQQLIVDGQLLAAELLQQRDAIQTLFVRTSLLSDQLQALVRDGQTKLRPALQQLQGTLNLAIKNRNNLALMLQRLAPFERALGEALGSGPFFLTYIANLTPEGFPTN